MLYTRLFRKTFFFTFICLAIVAARAEVVQLPASEYQDLLRGGWAGQILGSAVAERAKNGKLAPEEISNAATQWEQERDLWLQFHPEPWDVGAEAEYCERFGERLEVWLDSGFGECHLRQPEVHVAARKHLLHFDDMRYAVDVFVLMPNHVHALLRPRDGHDLFDLLQGIKGVSARTYNKLLGRTGATFWMEDSYNRLVRNAEELQALLRYIADNPSKARLRDDEFTLATNHVLYVQS